MTPTLRGKHPVRTGAAPHTLKESLKQWAMLLFESVGVGAVAVLLVLAAVLVIVGVYVQIIWPLTDWDLVNVSGENYRSLATTVLLTIFVSASAGGYWCISGAAWKKMKAPTNLTGKAAVGSRR